MRSRATLGSVVTPIVGHDGLKTRDLQGLALHHEAFTRSIDPAAHRATDSVSNMPELPEVETIRRQLSSVLPGRTIVAADAHPSPRFADAARCTGRQILEVGRRGKYLIIATTDVHEIIIHLGMTGRLTFSDTEPTTLDQDGTEPWRRAWWRLDDTSILEYIDQRRFGRIAVVERGDHTALATLAALGPEPESPAFTPDHLHRALAIQGRHVKTALLGQRVVAGIGNIYADEALWRAGINPVMRRLGPERAAKLHRAIIDVVREAIDHGGTRLRDYRSIAGDTGEHQYHLDCYGRAGQPCRRCGTLLARRMVDGRGTTWCPNCQRR